MTQQKKLKQLIRARMAKTGETCTTARRHILAHAPDEVQLPTGVLPAYTAFGPRQHHDSGLVAHVLRPVYAQFLEEAAPLLDDRLADAAALIRQSGRGWSQLATLAQDTASGLGAYIELAEERLELMFSRGPDAAPEVREMNARLDAMTADYAATDPLGDSGRAELFEAMADLVDACAEQERQAVQLLRAAA
ncbi:hypothetical protein [Dactylosporangium salmoneum]|uniref:Uncharacterized protein n=1 Tax=Dactylosporangium salmoneum TaxID=53361 RepID=A0ABN3FLU6_9ACTN